LRKEEELNGGYEDEVPYVSPVYEERRYKPKNESVPMSARADSDDGYVVNDQSEPFEFAATQAPPQPQVVHIEEQVIAKPASKVKINPFSTKPKDPSFLLPSTATPLGGLKAVAKALTTTSTAVAAPQKRKQMGIMAFASVNTEKKVKASVPSEANTAVVQKEALKEKKASGSSFIPKVSVKDHFAAVADSIAEKEAIVVPNKSIIPANETEEERMKREGIEMMFADENQNPDPKGKGPANPKSLLKNQGWTMEDQQIIN
jgi:hypothetical protein